MTLELKLIGKKGNGMVCLVEKDAPPIYQLRTDKTDDGVFSLDDELVHSVVLDGLYTEGARKKRLNLPYRRRGRNIEVLVKQPYHVEDFDGVNFHAVTFKGAGARPRDSTGERRYVIDPFTWRDDGIRQFGRMFGTVFEDKRDLVLEAKNKLLASRNVFHTPYVAQNKIPEEVSDEIYKVAKEMNRYTPSIITKKQDNPHLYQIVRFSMTNIRAEEFWDFSDSDFELFAKLSLDAGWTLERWAEYLGTVAGKLTKVNLRLAAQRKFLQFSDANFHDNLFITGEITDLEQVVIDNYDIASEYILWPSEMMSFHCDFIKKLSFALKEEDYLGVYFRKVSETSGYEFNSNQYDKKYLKYRGEKLTKSCGRKKVHA